jgi:cytoplasmic iron level regulating protein YaaA (DUF328/UPF0246 family)
VTVLVLLPPSETKAEGGDGDPLDLARLSFPDLNPVRRKLADALVELARDIPGSITALGLSVRQETEVARNSALFESPTMPALRRYTGVLYDALGAATLTKPEYRRAGRRLAVASALFGVVRATDPIPAYRCSGDSGLPGVGPLRELWRPVLEPALGELDELVVDLRSSAYAHLARLPLAVTVRVVTEQDGRRLAISHHNKAYKGALARALAVAPKAPATVNALIRVAATAGLVLAKTGPRSLDLVTAH